MKILLIVALVLAVSVAVALLLGLLIRRGNRQHDHNARWEMYSRPRGSTLDDGWEVGVELPLYDAPIRRVIQTWDTVPDPDTVRQVEGEAIARAVELNLEHGTV